MIVVTTSFFILLCIYLIVAFFSLEAAKSPFGFFSPERKNRTRISLIFSGVTLGTGFAYISDLAAGFGVWAIIGMLGITTGYLLISYLEHLNKKSLIVSPSDKSANYARQFEGVNKGYLVWAFNVARVIAFIGLIAFELWWSSIYIGSLFGLGETDVWLIGLALLLALLVFTYTILGGFPAAVRTDLVQGASVVVLLVVFLMIAVSSLDGAGKGVFASIASKTDLLSLSAYAQLIGIFLTAVATQFYGVANFITTRQRTAAENRVNFLIAGVAQPGILILVLIIAIFFSSGTYGSTEGFISSVTGGDRVQDMLLSVLILVGLTSILFTTVDTFIVALVQMSGDIFGKDTDSTSHEYWPRVYAAVLAIFVIPAALILTSRNPDAVPFFLTILMPISGLAIFFAAKTYVRLKRQVATPKLYDHLCAIVVGVGFLAAVFDYIYNDGKSVHVFTIIAFIPSVLVLLLVRRADDYPGKHSANA